VKSISVRSVPVVVAVSIAVVAALSLAVKSDTQIAESDRTGWFSRSPVPCR
jgi:hypothetical protein